ncbi:hypothetical protein DYP60_13530 [Sphaerochaeta halotolerans]|uniref:Uncharacterized protein n=2 Tax=Sphaerochaeta halotolerans TaxID=2293840 RepID=A0A372MD11_9SPIR|nr:hypothetical protein DYP60_13530 [Sphaerochaeta halotolerans]
MLLDTPACKYGMKMGFSLFLCFLAAWGFCGSSSCEPVPVRFSSCFQRPRKLIFVEPMATILLDTDNSGKAKIITPFVGQQLKICKYYGLEIPEGCTPKVIKVSSKTGRKNKNAA